MTGEKKVSSGIKKQENAVRNLNITINNYSKVQRKAAADTDRLRKASKGLTNQFIRVNLASRAISLGIHQLSSAFTFGVGSAIDFGFTIKKISAISGVAGMELKSLENTIKGIASVSPKTSSQVAQAALEMSKMGLAGKDLENSLAGVVNLSVALDEEVSAVGQTMLSVKNIFNKDASEMTAIADMMFTTLGNSALNLEKFSTAFAFAGASARLSGVSFQETSAMMGVLADNGIKASTIGTQLRQVFTRLDDPTSNVSKLLGEQSIKTRGLSQTLMILKGLIKDSGDAKKLFGQRAIGVIDILTRENSAISELTTKVEDMTKSTAKAAEMLGGETIRGALDRFKSAFELTFINVQESSSGFWHAVTNMAANGMKRFADSLDDTLSESEFIIEHVNKNWAEMVKARDFEDVRSLSPFLLAGERKVLEEEGKTAYKNYLKELKAIKEMDDKTSFIPQVDAGDFNMTADNNFRIPENKTANEKNKSNQEAANLEIIAIKAAQNQAIKDANALKDLKILNEWESSMEKASTRQAKASKQEHEAFQKSIMLQQQLTEGYETQMSLFPEFADAFGDMASKMEVGITALNTAVGGLSTGLTDLAFGGTLENFRNAMLGTIKSIINGFIEAAIRAAIFKAVLGVATGGAAFSPAGSGVGGLSNLLGAPKAGGVPGGLPFSVFPKASGFEGVVSQPTTFTVGEEGAEEVMVRPRAKMGAGSSKGAGMTVIIQGDINGEEQFIDRIRSANEEIERRSA